MCREWPWQTHCGAITVITAIYWWPRFAQVAQVHTSTTITPHLPFISSLSLFFLWTQLPSLSLFQVCCLNYHRHCSLTDWPSSTKLASHYRYRIIGLYSHSVHSFSPSFSICSVSFTFTAKLTVCKYFLQFVFLKIKLAKYAHLNALHSTDSTIQ